MKIETKYVHKTVLGNFTCLKEEINKPCPFCEAHEALLASGRESDNELGKNYKPEKMYGLVVTDSNSTLSCTIPIIYEVSNYGFLEIIIKGGIPVWSKEAKKYVNK